MRSSATGSPLRAHEGHTSLEGLAVARLEAFGEASLEGRRPVVGVQIQEVRQQAEQDDVGAAFVAQLNGGLQGRDPVHRVAFGSKEVRDIVRVALRFLTGEVDRLDLVVAGDDEPAGLEVVRLAQSLQLLAIQLTLLLLTGKPIAQQKTHLGAIQPDTLSAKLPRSLHIGCNACINP